MDEVTPLLGGVTEEDIDQVMRLGGNMVKLDIALEEIPTALDAILAIKRDNFRIYDLFKRHDTDKTGKLYPCHLRTLLAEINEGVAPTQEDIDLVIKLCDKSRDGHIVENEIKATLSAWYLRAELGKLPGTHEEAAAMGYAPRLGSEEK
eukprot:CAMPEP_0172620388 /NCGR_PEP_ID=MMETSP1068-20121228/103151_1 /TAXON_ID=35684 /ORGANISM="Pseudopedinella elastica, Strain CCMP716" /LENGTH=148 /DNA_ID=CAMNT_0013427625 /DNA_START=219 /DNA_END=665 /DNA_ORIENTATION=-